jgi:hypothetical protein
VKIAVDFDGVIAQHSAVYSVTSPLVLVPYAREGLLALKAAGHRLLLWSARASKALREDPSFDPFVRARGGLSSASMSRWQAARPLHQARYERMLEFVARELPGVFEAVDEGHGGKPIVDLFIDDRCLRFGSAGDGWSWDEIAGVYGGQR